MNQPISFKDWQKLDLRVGKVLLVERVPNRDKLYKIQVDIGTKEPIQIISSLAPYYQEKELIGKIIVVLVNLEPAKFAGEISQGMLLAAETDDASKCVLLTTDQAIEPGTKIT